MPLQRAYLYDANPIDLRDRRTRLVDQLRTAGVLDRWHVCVTPSRNALLWSIDNDSKVRGPRNSVTLIDLRGETGDLGQSGFSVCKAISRHPDLSSVTRPVVWVDVHSAANLGYARSVGAFAVVDDEWVDEGAGQPLAEVLLWARQQEPVPAGRPARRPRVFPEDHGSIDEEDRRRVERFERWFGFAPKSPDLDFALLWGMAEAVELRFLLGWVTEAGFATSERAA